MGLNLCNVMDRIDFYHFLINQCASHNDYYYTRLSIPTYRISDHLSLSIQRSAACVTASSFIRHDHAIAHVENLIFVLYNNYNFPFRVPKVHPNSVNSRYMYY